MSEGVAREGHWAKRVITGVGAAVRRAALAQVSRVRVASDRRTQVEQKQLEWARGAIDEGARLTKASIEYSVQLGAAWRTLTLDAWRSALGASAADNTAVTKG